MTDVQRESVRRLIAREARLAEHLRCLQGLSGEVTVLFSEPTLAPSVEQGLVDAGVIGPRTAGGHVILISDEDIDACCGVVDPGAPTRGRDEEDSDSIPPPPSQGTGPDPVPEDPQFGPDAALALETEIRKMLQPLRPEEREMLEASIQIHGVLSPILVWKGIVLDGHNRLAIGTKLGIDVPRQEVALSGPEEARPWVIEHQLGRRNLTDDQWAALLAIRNEIRAALSRRERAATGGRARHGVDSSEVQTASEQPKERLRERTAREAGVSVSRLRRAAEIGRKDAGTLLEVAAGKMTMREARGKLGLTSRSKASKPRETSRPAPVAAEDGTTLPQQLADEAEKDSTGLDALLCSIMALGPQIDDVQVVDQAGAERARGLAADLTQMAKRLADKADMQKAAVAA